MQVQSVTLSAIDQAKAGSDDAFEELVQAHGDAVWGLLVARLGNMADAQDAMQETWIRVLKALPRYRDDGRFLSWVLRIAHREAMRVARRNRRRGGIGEVLEKESVDPRPRPDQNLHGSERLNQIEMAIQQLDDHTREAVWLRVVQDLPFREVARILRVPENTAHTRVRRGLEKLRVSLAQEQQT